MNKTSPIIFVENFSVDKSIFSGYRWPLLQIRRAQMNSSGKASFFYKNICAYPTYMSELSARRMYML